MPRIYSFKPDLFLPQSHARAKARGPRAAEDNPALQAIWDIIGALPRGTTSSYGAVARAAGLPGRARLAGRALKLAPDDLHLPWYRVVGADGRIAFPKGSSKWREQARLLRAEGVKVRDGRVPAAFMNDLEHF